MSRKTVISIVGTKETRIDWKFNVRKMRREWFFRTRSLANGKLLARSTESYFNRSELIENMSDVANSLIQAVKDSRK